MSGPNATRSAPLPPPVPPGANPSGPASRGRVDGGDAPPAAPPEGTVPRDRVEARPERSSGQHPAPQRDAVRNAVDALLEDGGTHALDAHLRGSPAELLRFARMDEDELREALRAELDRRRPGVLAAVGNWLKTESAVGSIQEVVNAEVRSRVQRRAEAAVRHRMGSLAELRAGVESLLPRLRRSVGESSPAGALARSLGVRGDEGDAARARGRIEASLAKLQRFLEHLQGQTWTPTDFPRTLDRVAREMGVELDRSGTLGEIAARPTRRWATHFFAEGGELAGALEWASGVAGGLGYGLGGMSRIAFGSAMVALHAAEEIADETLDNIERRRALGYALGL